MCSVPWGVLSTVGDVQYHGGYHDKCGGYLEYCVDILSTVGVILSTMGDTPYPGGYHDARGDIMSIIEGNLRLFKYPHGTEHPTVLMISPHMYHDITPWYSNYKGWYLPWY